ncbi:phage portal protein [Lentilactobacillus kosonis]|uniref:Phage portal protein n=1 Tax=Lentilactobacillus kosonis TaxID=2810561 RepID=A0A401FPR8_9LACO|nr:phage portal protein [Lentilactobacillus kosonis]GAY74343.1 phage portal protein [Lentilactobacillus kosonis]
MKFSNPFKRLFSNKSYLPSTDYQPFLIVDGQVVQSASYVNASQALKNSDVYSVINMISADVSSCRFESENSFVLHKLNAPNPILNSYNFWQSVMASLLLNGNSYVVMQMANDRLDHFEQLQPSQVQIVVDDGENTLNYKITYNDNRHTVTIPAGQMLHFKLMSNLSVNKFVGVSPLQSLIADLNIQDKANGMALKSITEAIRPNGILTLNAGAVDPDAKEHMRSEFERANSGENAGRVMVLDQTATYSSPQIDSNIASLLNSVSYTRTQVAKAFGVPQDFLNNESAHSNIDQVRSTYSQSLNKYIYAISSELTMKLGTGVDLDMQPAIDPDYMQYASTISDLAKNKALDGTQSTFVLKKVGVIPPDTPDYTGDEPTLKGGE